MTHDHRCSHNGLDLSPHCDRPVQPSRRSNAAQHRLDLSPYAGASPASSSLHAVSSCKAGTTSRRVDGPKWHCYLHAEERIANDTSKFFNFYIVILFLFSYIGLYHNTNNILPYHTIYKYVLSAYLHLKDKAS